MLHAAPGGMVAEKWPELNTRTDSGVVPWKERGSHQGSMARDLYINLAAGLPELQPAWSGMPWIDDPDLSGRHPLTAGFL